MKPIAFERWIRRARIGDSAIYYEGDLAYDRKRDKHAPWRERAQGIADYVYLHADVDVFTTERCDHVQFSARVVGRAVVALIRERAGEGRWTYQAKKIRGGSTRLPRYNGT